MLHLFQTQLKQHFPYLHPKHTKLLLAVSGGVDSVVLTDLFAKAGFDFVIAHCNFHLRAAESDRDEQFVRAFAKQQNKPLLVQHFDTEQVSVDTHSSIEEAARALRYTWFQELLNDKQLFPLSLENKFIVTGHHANDTIETLLINFFRGCGIAGLHGIPLRNEQIIRPLLFASREQINTYAVEHHLQWIEDSSNQSEKYTRNFFRNNFLPGIQQYFPQVQQNLLHNIERLGQAELLYQQAVQVHKKKLLIAKGKEYFIPILLLQKTEAYQTLLWEILKDYAFAHTQVPEVVKLIGATTGAHIDSATHRIFKNRNHLVLTALNKTVSQQILIQKDDKEILLQYGSISIVTYANDNRLDANPAIALLDADKVTFPLLLRKWKEGDYFYPLGMRKKKKLSRFFIDQKMSMSQKENVWVLEHDKKIVWLAGWRIDERYKITALTKKILKLSFQPQDA